MSKRKHRRQHSTAQKAAILRRHFVDKVPVSDVCDEFSLQPSVFYRWREQLFGNAEAALESPAAQSKANVATKALEREKRALEAKLAKKDHVIAEISEDYIALKKSNGGL